MSGRADDPRLRAWRGAFVTTSLVAGALDEELRERTAIDLQVYDALLHVFEAGEEGIRMTDLARRIVMSKAGLTSLVDRLQARDLLQRRPDPADRRAHRIVLTEHGLATFLAAAKVHVDGIERWFGRHVTEDEADLLRRVFDRIAAAHG